MGRKIAIIETTIRDGQQSLWSTRMTSAMFLPILPVMDRAGFHTLEIMGVPQADVCVRYLKENPWERIRLARERAPHTPLGMIAGRLGFSLSRGAMPDDLLPLFYDCCAANGIRRFFVMDGLNDMRNVEVSLASARATGGTVMGTVNFSISPVHTDEYFAGKVQELVAQDVDVVVLKDPNGLLTPERVRTLVPAMARVAGERPIYCHSHCVTGLGPAANLEAVRCGASGLWTCAAPLANGSSLPATASMVRHLERMGYDTGLDLSAVHQVDEHFLQVAQRHGKPVGEPAEYDPAYFDHQLPGGMISNFRTQLAELGLGDRLEAVLDLIPAVREDVGWTPMVTPFSQIIATQAALNLLYGPYEVVVTEMERLVLGYYGLTPAPVRPDVLDRVGRGQQPITERPGSLLPPVVERMRREQGPFASDEDLLLAFFFMPDQLSALRAAGPMATAEPAPLSPLVNLVREVAKRKHVTGLRLILPHVGGP